METVVDEEAERRSEGKRKREEKEHARMARIKEAKEQSPEELMEHLKGDTALHKLLNEFWKNRNGMVRGTVLRGRYRVMPAKQYKKGEKGKKGTRCKLCKGEHALYAEQIMDGRDNPGSRRGMDDIPSFVDIVVLEGTESRKLKHDYTREEARKEIRKIYLFEITYAKDTE
ncbi:hypothetical protein CYMTET_7313 [Cymbomonas tetramitiformis]|uniref:Uncharacterized protein n=1 Tax=Cymbomonas tetramitiformis TaxID=36881 RepID=A0AAE0GVR4_9CHLO|nr:hypothetical protein CYMTET_7313 [Cymbomonas tetramitiformis]